MLSVAIPVEDSSRVAEARRAAVDLASSSGFSEAEAGRVALIATEAATNMVRHAGGGELIASVVERGGRAGIQMLALDRGPGIPDLERCLRDGYSTAGSCGTGLGAIQRLSSEVEFYSVRGKGTAVLSRIWSREVPRNGCFGWASVVVPIRGEQVSGDACSVRAIENGVSVLVVDGLGHGQGAAQAAQAAVEAFNRNPDLPQPELMERIHGALRSTRGAAVALARVSGRTVRFTGVGNIAGSVVTAGSTKHMVSHPGTVGLEMRKVHEFTYEWPGDAFLFMFSDGIVTHWSLNDSPGLLERDPAVIAGVLYKEFTRRRDDATVLVLREGAGCQS